MADHPRVRRKDGVTMAPGANPGKAAVLLSVAVALVCVALLVLFGRPTRAPSPSEPPAPPAAAASGRASHESAPAPAPLAPPAEPSVPEAEPESAVERARPAAAERAPGAEAGDTATVPSGIGLFPPPGTDPTKIGLVVPDDFELPEGYLRHYQVTDDGQELPPILLFHPDYEMLGPDGKPIPLPEDHVVPPELAPAGMPIEQLVVPEPLDEDAP